MNLPALLPQNRDILNQMRIALLVLVLLLSSLSAFSPFASADGEETSIQGLVTDKDSGEALEAVTISIRGEGGNYSLETDEDGYYHQIVAADSDYTVKARLEGYGDELDRVFVEEAEEEQMDFQMKKEVNGRTWYVDDDAAAGGDGSKETPLQTIQDGVDNASDGDKIFVYAGRYYENVVVNVSVELTGASRDNTTIDGGKSGTVLEIVEDKVTVQGFTITRSGSSSKDSGLRLKSSQNVILYNNCSGNRVALEMGMSLDNLIRGNIFTQSGYRGVYLSNSDGNIFDANSWLGNGYDELYLSVSYSNNFTGNRFEVENGKSGVSLNMASYNNFLNNTVQGGYNAMVLTSSMHNLIQDNHFSKNTGNFSILMGRDTKRNIIRDNQFIGDRELIPTEGRGLEFFRSEESSITGNLITGFQLGIYSKESEELEVHFNSINNNTMYGVLEELGAEINATNNWWGAVSGPHHKDNHSEGEGDEVSDHVLYEPWLESEDLSGNRSTLSGSVYVNGSGKAVNNALVTVSGLDCNCSYSARTNVNGYYERLLGSGGNFSVKVVRDGYNSSQDNVTVPPGESVSLNFYLDKQEAKDWTRIYGQARDERTGEPLEGVKIVIDNGSAGIAVYTDQDGNYDQDFDEPGDFTLTATMSGYLAGSSSFSLVANQVKRQDFQMEHPPSKGKLALEFLDTAESVVTLHTPEQVWYQLDGGKEYRLDVEIEAGNTGEGRVNYTFFDPGPEDFSPSPNLRVGEVDVVARSSGGEFFIDPGQKQTHPVTIDVDAQTITPGVPILLPLHFRDDDKMEEFSMLVNITILSIYELELRDLEDNYSQELPLSGELELELEIKNLGNSFVDLIVRRTTDDPFEITQMSPWNDMFPDLAPVSLDQDATGTISLRLEVPYRPAPGNYLFQLKIYPAGETKHTIYANYSILVADKGSPWVGFTVEQDEVVAGSSDSFEMNLTVTNKGDLRDSFYLEVKLSDDDMQHWLTGEDDLLGLDPGESVVVRLRVTTPANFEGSESVRITITSMSDFEASDVETIKVREEREEDGDDDSPGFQGAGMLVALCLAMLLVKRFRRRGN